MNTLIKIKYYVFFFLFIMCTRGNTAEVLYGEVFRENINKIDEYGIVISAETSNEVSLIRIDYTSHILCEFDQHSVVVGNQVIHTGYPPKYISGDNIFVAMHENDIPLLGVIFFCTSSDHGDIQSYQFFGDKLLKLLD